MSVERPKQGGRVELVLEAGAEHEINYRMTLVTASGEWAGRASVTPTDGATRLEPEGAPRATPATDANAGDGGALPPRWLTDFVRQLLRTAWNARRGEGPSAWPARITRWRDEKSPPP